MKVGDFVIQMRAPGGYCIILRLFNSPKEYNGPGARCGEGVSFWADADWPIIRVLHPTEGVIDDPTYYYRTIKEYLEGYEVCR